MPLVMGIFGNCSDPPFLHKSSSNDDDPIFFFKIYNSKVILNLFFFYNEIRFELKDTRCNKEYMKYKPI